MKIQALVFSLCVLCASIPVMAGKGDSSASPGAYPVDAALSKHEDGTWVFKSFPDGSRLYTYDGDSPGKSNCNKGCVAAWPPLFVSDENAGSVGQWTVIVRGDGRKQWAYKDQPVYRRYHDIPAKTAQYKKEGFHLLAPDTQPE